MTALAAPDDPQPNADIDRAAEAVSYPGIPLTTWEALELRNLLHELRELRGDLTREHRLLSAVGTVPELVAFDPTDRAGAERAYRAELARIDGHRNNDPRWRDAQARALQLQSRLTTPWADSTPRSTT